RPAVAPLRSGGDYLGGSAARLERDLGISGDEILYVGDHMFGDVRATKRILRWRTALILRELEAEGEAIGAFRPTEVVLAARMRKKEALEAAMDQARLLLARRRGGYGPPVDESEASLEARAQALRAELLTLDAEIAPLARATATISHPRWGLLTR